jgi:glycosyltransferase involved in cell wall biosynthesis
VTPPLAICIPTYNRSASLGPLLDRIAAEAPEVPVLVADNASPDDTEALLQRVARPSLLVHRHAENVGSLANIRWLLANAPDAGHVWLLCDDDLPTTGTIAAVGELVAREDPAWLHLPHRWEGASGEVVNRSPCPRELERHAGAGALYRAYGHWLTFGSAAVVRRDLLVRAAATIATTNAYGPLVWFARAAADGPCLVAPFCGVVAGTEISWADRATAIVTEDYPALFDDAFSPFVDRAEFAASLDVLYGGAWGQRLWRSAGSAQVARVLERFPASRVLRRMAVERATADRDDALLELVAGTVGDDDRARASAARIAGAAAFERGDLAGAAELLAAANLADPLDAETWSDLGVALHETGELAVAIDALEIALVLAPGHEDARANLAAVRGR